MATFLTSAQEIKKDTIIDDMIIIRGDSLEISLDEIKDAYGLLLAGKAVGRYVVKI